MIVADSGPILASARIGRLDILQQVVEELIIPEAVYREIVVQGEGMPGAAEVAQERWFRLQPVRDTVDPTDFPSSFGAGQMEAILLAQELGAQLLIDEGRGRREAYRRGIEVLGSLRILAEAKRLGFIQETKPFIDTMRGAGYHLGDFLVSVFLMEIGENH